MSCELFLNEAGNRKRGSHKFVIVYRDSNLNKYAKGHQINGKQLQEFYHGQLVTVFKTSKCS